MIDKTIRFKKTIIFNELGTFDQTNLKSLFVDCVLTQYMKQNNIKKLMVILDQAPPHMSKLFRSYMSSKKIHTVSIPKLIECYFTTMRHTLVF